MYQNHVCPFCKGRLHLQLLAGGITDAFCPACKKNIAVDKILVLDDDNINHPKHYTSHPSGVECIEITEHYNFNVGNAIKYVWRAGIKSEEGKTDLQKQIEDLGKAKWYIERELQRLNNQLTNPE